MISSSQEKVSLQEILKLLVRKKNKSLFIYLHWLLLRGSSCHAVTLLIAFYIYKTQVYSMIFILFAWDGCGFCSNHVIMQTKMIYDDFWLTFIDLSSVFKPIHNCFRIPFSNNIFWFPLNWVFYSACYRFRIHNSIWIYEKYMYVLFVCASLVSKLYEFFNFMTSMHSN